MSYPTPQEAVVVAAAERLAAETMARYDPSHDNFHVQRLAALLHDVLDKKYVSPAQAADPYAFFLPFFEAWAAQSGVDLVQDGRAREIARIVTNVSWSTEKKLREAGLVEDWHRQCVELHCVQDADRLDAIGAFGILRCAAYSAAVNRPLHADAGDPAREETAIQHFYDKLLHIKDQLKTEPGKAMAEKRHKLMLQFLAAVDAEYDGES
ncbi:hypothetical protein PHLGIDRAFT_21857 [Phlebiopsis gigantea 11061_1 CR5-6]|uniref:HD/PDEase domain-containing protein n=1 Tax=Phlebiopsis gigantea (strain 11061_1 CR5-6) TaxID=745531 RepID=A0A0C3PU80_PHLG1|nr:hypothetical protein PHLGIDRAFT_21857 [Phlebiopsis gigantea 11061_1 CR5-6]